MIAPPPSLRCLALWAAVLLTSATPGFAQVAARIEPNPIMRIGSADGEEQYLFTRISGAVRLSTGEIVVANAGSNEVRWFSSRGQWLRTSGREGSGPGEFRGLRRLLPLPGDSVLVEDGLAARMTMYDGQGQLVRSWQISPAGTFVTPPPIGRLADGSFIAMTERELTPPPGYSQYQAILIRYRDGALIDTLATVAGSESYSVRCGTATSPGVCNMGVPYGVRALATVARGRVFVGNGERYELLRIDPSTGRTDTLRRNVAALALDRARREFFVDSQTAGLAPARGALVRERYVDAPARRTMPFFHALLADDQGQLWLARPHPPNAARRVWDLLDENGRFLGSVELPTGLRVTHISGGHVVGIRTDDDGVESVEVYRVR